MLNLIKKLVFLNEWFVSACCVFSGIMVWSLVYLYSNSYNLHDSFRKFVVWGRITLWRLLFSSYILSMHSCSIDIMSWNARIRELIHYHLLRKLHHTDRSNISESTFGNIWILLIFWSNKQGRQRPYMNKYGQMHDSVLRL